jgi:hypothetical protein
MIFFGLEFVGAKLIGAKLLAAHSAHALAAKGALAAQHPLPAAAHVAIHRGVTYAITHPAVSTAATVPHVPVLTPGATAAVLSHGPAGASGPAAASSAPVKILHVARELAIPVATGVALGQARKTELVREAKAALSDLYDTVKDELRTCVTS